jgi:hypothetical protein
MTHVDESTTPTNPIAHASGGGSGPIPISPPADEVSRRVLGTLFAGVLLVFVGLFVYFVVNVVGPMTRPSPYFEQLTKSLQEQPEPRGRLDELSVDLAVMLEYASADIRMAGVQIAFALVGGLFFAAVGVLLLTATVSGAIQLGAKAGGGQFTISSTTPGLACLAFGAVIVSFGVMRDVSRPLRSEIKRPVGVVYQDGSMKVPNPVRVEDTNASVTKAEVEAAKKALEAEAARKATGAFTQP